MRKTGRDIARNKRPVVALIVMIMLGVATLTSTYGAYANLQDSVDETYADLRFHDALLEIEPTTRSNLSAIDGVQGVAEWEARLVVDLPATFASGEPPVMATIISLPPLGEPTVDILRYLEGQAPSEGTSDIVIEAGFANHHNIEVGDVVNFTTALGAREVRVAGIALSPEYLWPAKTVQEHMPDVLRRWGAMWMLEGSLQALTGQSGIVNQIVLKVSPGANVNEVIRGAEAALGDRAVVRAETRERQASNVVFGLLVNAVSQMAYVLPLLFLSIVGLSTYVLLTRLILQQRANIGLLRALGFQPRRILLHYLTYAPLLAGLGAILGFVVGYALSFEVTRIFGSYVSLTEIPVKLRPDLLLIGFLLSLVFAGAASVLPAWGASRLKPSEAMRPPVPPKGRRSLVERVVPHSPLTLRLGLRNVGRNPRRSIFTILGIALAVSVLVVPLVVIDSLNNVTEVAVVRVQQADEILILRQPVNTTQIGQVIALDGVAGAEPLIQLQASFDLDGVTRDVSVIGLEPDSELMRLTNSKGEQIHTSDSGIILSRVFERYGIEKGDMLVLFGEDVMVTEFTQAGGTSGFASLATAQRWGNIPDAANQVMIKRDVGANQEDVDRRIGQVLPVGATLDVPQAIQDTRDMLRLYYAMVYIILVFGIVIGGAIVFNTISINVLEESRDFATLRMLGFPTRSLGMQVTTETLALAVPGVLFGLGLGIILANYFVGIFSSDLFVLDVYLLPTSLLLAIVTGLATALIAQLPNIRLIGRLDLARIVRERSG